MFESKDNKRKFPVIQNFLLVYITLVLFDLYFQTIKHLLRVDKWTSFEQRKRFVDGAGRKITYPNGERIDSSTELTFSSDESSDES